MHEVVRTRLAIQVVKPEKITPIELTAHQAILMIFSLMWQGSTPIDAIHTVADQVYIEVTK